MKQYFPNYDNLYVKGVIPWLFESEWFDVPTYKKRLP